MKKVRELKSWIEGYEQVTSAVGDLQVLFDFAKEGEATEEEVDAQYQETIRVLEDIEMRNMLRREEDHFGAIMKINSGAGGTESMDWASMLYRMYIRWGELNGYKVKHVDYQEGEEAGIKSATLEFEGDYAYGYLKSENGVHRLVRLSPYNAANKRMTSFASVFVYPAVDDTIEITINPADISWDTSESVPADVGRVDRDHDQPCRHQLGHFPKWWGGRPEREQGRNRSSVTPRSYRNHDRKHGIALTVTKP